VLAGAAAATENLRHRRLGLPRKILHLRGSLPLRPLRAEGVADSLRMIWKAARLSGSSIFVVDESFHLHVFSREKDENLENALLPARQW
jgi:hypothetical protein